MSSNGTPAGLTPSSPTTFDPQQIILQLQNENMLVKHKLAEWHATAMKWQHENATLFQDNQKLYVEKKALEADKQILEASNPQADLIRQLAQRNTDIQKLISDNTILSQHNQALNKTCDNLRKERDSLLQVITCSRNEATFNQLSIDYQRILEANRAMAKQLHHTKGELESIKSTRDIVLGQVQELQKAGYITIRHGPLLSNDAPTGGPSSQPPSNVASPINSLHYSLPSANASPLIQPVPQALPQNSMHGPQMAHGHPTQAVVVPRRLPHPHPSPSQVQIPTQPQPPRHFAPLRVVIPAPASSKPIQANHHQSQNPSPTAFVPTQSLNPNPPQSHSAGSPQTTVSPSQMYIESSHIPSPSSSRHPNMSHPHSSPLSIQPPLLPPQYQEQSITIIPSVAVPEPRQRQMQEIPTNPATGLTFREDLNSASDSEVNAPPTPPRSLKSMSPEESIHGRLKRSSSSEDVGGGIEDDRQKRMRLDEASSAGSDLQTAFQRAEMMVGSEARLQDVAALSTGQGSTIPSTVVAEQPVPPVSSLSAPMEAEEEEEEVVQLERGPDGLFKEEEIVPHLFESDGDNNELLHCPFCLVKQRATNTPPQNFADASIAELLQHYKETHSHILAKVCQEGLDMLYSSSS